jgi:hypothetical protein
MKNTIGVVTISLLGVALAGCTAPVESAKEESTSKTSEALTAPTLTANRTSPFNVDLSGSGFTPGGGVTLYIYSGYFRTMNQQILTATPNAYACVRGVCRVIPVGGGISTSIANQGCDETVVWAYDQESETYSNEVSLGAC